MTSAEEEREDKHVFESRVPGMRGQVALTNGDVCGRDRPSVMRIFQPGATDVNGCNVEGTVTING